MFLVQITNCSCDNEEVDMSDQSAALLPLEQSLTPHPIDAAVRIGHVHLKVADLDRALAACSDSS